MPVTVLVTAFTVLEEGPFALTTAFTPQVCGDRMVIESEACDDGNVTAGDGCSADCSSIEYPYWCSQAQSLPLDVTVSGEVGGQWSLYTPTCGDGNGADVLYELTAPVSGNLTVSLNQLVGDS